MRKTSNFQCISFDHFVIRYSNLFRISDFDIRILPEHDFSLRLEDGDVVPECIERFAKENGVSVGHVVLVGGIGGGQVVVGPRHSNESPPDPMLLPVDGAHEVVGVGVLAPGQDGKPVLHIHAALGRSGQTLTGCLRPGVTTWLVGEVILYEILGAKAARVMDKVSGFALLEPGASPESG
ncbi:MAG: DNA-binding protein [Deltaproteobacteria bacterium]|nr:DNA-binding protein [Deltaproteobacteria bacterium]